MTPKKILTYIEHNNLYVLSESVIQTIKEKKGVIISHELYPYILESEHKKQIEELEEEIRKWSETQIPADLSEFVNQAMYVIGLQKNKKFTKAELSKRKLFEMFEDIIDSL